MNGFRENMGFVDGQRRKRKSNKKGVSHSPQQQNF